MARTRFGGTHADRVGTRHHFSNLLSLVPGAFVTLWDAEVGGTRYIDLLLDGQPVQGVTADDEGGIPVFEGPDGVTEIWASANGGRRRRLAPPGPQGEPGPPGPPGPPGGSDADTATWISDTSPSLTRGALDALFVGKGDLVVNAADHGASPSASASANAAALNAAAAATLALSANARLLIPPGTYNINDTVTVACHLDADQATLRYTGSGTALIVGVNTSGAVTARKRFALPRVVKPSLGWDGTSVGVRLVNLNTCSVYIPFVQNFERGLVVYGFGQGIAYSHIVLGALWENRRQLILDCDASGWSNQNTYLGGRLQQTTDGGIDDIGAGQMILGETPGAAPNNNTFIGTSIEGDNPGFYRLDVSGRYNKWINCRWENMGGASRVRWRADALYNVIEHGYDAQNLTETVVAGAQGNVITDRDGAYVSASNASSFSVPSGAGFNTITGWTNASRRAPYTSGNGSWTPRQGRWRLTAHVVFNASGSTGTRRARFLAGGSTVIQVSDAPPFDGKVTTVRLSAHHRFDGATSLVIQAQQDSGSPVALSPSAGFVTFHAEYVGP